MLGAPGTHGIDTAEGSASGCRRSARERDGQWRRLPHGADPLTCSEPRSIASSFAAVLSAVDPHAFTGSATVSAVVPANRTRALIRGVVAARIAPAPERRRRPQSPPAPNLQPSTAGHPQPQA
jgi:hypothetical protein